MLAKLPKLPARRNKSLPRLCSVTKSQNGTLPCQLLHVSPNLRPCQQTPDRADFASDVSSVPGFSRRASRWYFTCSWHRRTMRNKDVELDVKMNLTLSHYNESPLLLNFFTSVWMHAALQPRRGHLLHDLVTHFFLKVAFKMESTRWESSLPTTTTAEMWLTQGTLETVWKDEFSLVTAITRTCGTSHGDSLPEILLTYGQSHISASSQLSGHYGRRRQ